MRFSRILLAVLVVYLAATSVSLAAGTPFVFGLLLVGPRNDKGYSQAQYEGGRYVEKHLPGARMIVLDQVNPTDRPGLTIPQAVDDMAAKGARLVIAGSEDMRDGILEAAARHPEMTFIHVSGDDTLTGKAPKNLGNLFARIEYAKMMAGFAAAMTTKTGRIGYLGPLLNDETRRVANAAYLGARYAWEHVRGERPEDLTFKVSWIGFWFNIPGVTSDPNQVAGAFFDEGFDVVVSGLDAPEALIVAGARRAAGADVFALPYVYKPACQLAPQACLGVPYFNWGPPFLIIARQVAAGTYQPTFAWLPPDFADINDPDTSPAGFMPGPGLSEEAKKALDIFTAALGAGGLDLYAGPLFYQDGTEFVPAGRTATDRELWYCPQLLRGMRGKSGAK
ncbi:BMP family lipoprotein [Desulfolutivibrio sulfoxidireducens]|uniref:BMP family lipoprotein n=1 Tax=Desulfolutivibrio sulfoxidireducens TaxID=2773299 RepID=UPI00159DA1E9|nr:BMP family ABC transporter substrate-binding protein [Desulfolutivibrio sulfoxidireducens]QLA17635.1 BMP family ABC transporter substrate-binding protein [Desulfolutivibrio sulfoxidireducens]QLA21207.1 BMP family ABC transporter substrate-binding protein [Desulfolutivibrio sulfoxidireducens]